MELRSGRLQNRNATRPAGKWTVSILPVLEYCPPIPAHRNARSIQIVQRLRLARGGLRQRCLHATRLERFEIAARRDLAISAAAPATRTRCRRFSAAEPDVARTQRHNRGKAVPDAARTFSAWAVSSSCAACDLPGSTICTSRPVDWLLPDHAARVPCRALRSSDRKQGECATYFNGRSSGSRIWSRTRFVTGTSAVGIR